MDERTLSAIKFDKPIALDGKDKKILEVLQKEARLPVSKIAKLVQMPADSVKYRIKRLEKLGVIRFYHAVLNFAMLGHPMYSYTLFSFFALDAESEKSFINFVTAKPKATFVAKSSGKWDFIVGTCTKDFKELDGMLHQIRSKFSKHIKDYDTISTIEEYKYDFMYGLIEP